jgi:SAM-dependent methyltransferase
VADLDDKLETQKQWNANPCGVSTAPGLEPGSREFFRKVEMERYENDSPWLKDAAGFDQFAGQRVLEIGPGLGTDHAQFARGGAHTFGVDLTTAHLQLTRRRLELEGFVPRLARGDAERLPFADGVFDAVYSFGVLHHTPDTQGAVEEIRRVLRPGGMAIAGLYHRHSAFYWCATILIRGLLAGHLRRKGYRRLMADIEQGSEASGTLPLVKVLSRGDCRRLFSRFSSVQVRSDHFDYCHIRPSRAPSPPDRRRRLERWGRYWGWFLTVRARK